jgi:hypothetical protein
MSAAIDSIECMFEYGEMAQAVATPQELEEEFEGENFSALAIAPTTPRNTVPDTAFTTGVATGAQTVQELQARIRSMQVTKLDSRLIPTHPAIASLLPGGGLQQGATYSVEHSAALLMTLLAGPSQAGTWCGVVGVPEFGVEAASSFGIDLERLVLVPNPGDQWLAVTAAIADVMGVVVTRPPKRATDSNLARLAARLRQRGSTLIVLGSWPQSEAMLSLTHSEWSGIGDGHGYLAARQATVTVTTRAGGRPRSARLWLPDAAGQMVGQMAGQAAGRASGRGAGQVAGQGVRRETEQGAQEVASQLKAVG